MALAGRSVPEINRAFAIPLACGRAFRKFVLTDRVSTIPLASRRGFLMFLVLVLVFPLPLACRRAFLTNAPLYRDFKIPLACRRAYELLTLFVPSIMSAVGPARAGGCYTSGRGSREATPRKGHTWRRGAGALDARHQRRGSVTWRQLLCDEPL